MDVKIITMKIEIPTNKTRKSSILLSFLLNKSNNLKQLIKAEIKSIKVLSQSKKRIEIEAIILYEDKKVKESGEILTETKSTYLTINYILGRINQEWKVIDFK